MIVAVAVAAAVANCVSFEIVDDVAEYLAVTRTLILHSLLSNDELRSVMPPNTKIARKIVILKNSQTQQKRRRKKHAKYEENKNTITKQNINNIYKTAHDIVKHKY